MLQIINFFKWITSIISFLWNGFINIVKTIFTVVTGLFNLFNGLPTAIKVLLILIVAVSVVYKIISLGGSGDS